jgi:hypothetical protein
MATSKIKGLDEQQLEGGVGGGGGMGRGSSTQIKEVPIDIKGAVEAAEKYQAKTRGRPVSDKPKISDYLGQRDYLKSEESLARKNRTAEEKAAEKAEKELVASRRQEALNNAKTEGIKTEYPYIEPTSKKAGGTVSASRRADGIAMRGKTKGKMI